MEIIDTPYGLDMPYQLVYVLDASAIINLRDIPELKEDALNIIPDSIVTEIKDYSSRMRLEALLGSHQLVVHHVDESVKKFLIKKIQQSGTVSKLSSSDLDVLTLGLQLQRQYDGSTIVVVTDDYEIQNIAVSILAFAFMPVTQKSIRNLRRWHKICSNCKQIIPQNSDECEVCGGVEYYYKSERITH